MQCEVKWNTLSLAAWEERFAAIRRSTLLQSYDYARAVCPAHGQRARWGLILIDGAEAGLVQILEAGLAGDLLHALVLDRGPLWFDGFGTQDHCEAFFAELNRTFPRRFARRRRIIPEIAADNPAAARLPALGYRKLPRPGYETLWLDLTKEKDALLAAMKPNWRNMIRKAEKAGLRIDWDRDGAALPGLLTNYQLDKATKGYDGPSLKLLRLLGQRFGNAGRLLVARAFLGNETLESDAVAGILVLCHGTSATYQIGWSGDAGRKTAAHNLLLWQAACTLKDLGYRDFDLGGVNDEAEGVKKFKQDMGGDPAVYAGHYL